MTFCSQTYEYFFFCCLRLSSCIFYLLLPIILSVHLQYFLHYTADMSTPFILKRKRPRTCACGSASHARITHYTCPLNPVTVFPAESETTNMSVDADENLPIHEAVENSIPTQHKSKRMRQSTCQCGSTTHLRRSHSSCPLNLSQHSNQESNVVYSIGKGYCIQ